MAVRAGDLRERLEVWKADLVTDENQETDSVYQPLRTIWAHVTPSSGRTATLPGETERAEITHKVTIRAPTLPEICREMYFVVRGQRLDVLYWYPVYNRRGWMEIFCRLTQGEVQADGNDAAVGAGKFILYIDEEGAVRIGQGINSMTTTDGLTRTEDMQFIETVEAMDMMRDDITAVFRETYLGNYRNSRDNQMLFIASLNASYFRQLAQENILDPDYANAASIDVEAQRAAWVASSKAEAADWDDDKVKATPFKRTVYLAGNVKILGSMTDLIFPINLF